MAGNMLWGAGGQAGLFQAAYSSSISIYFVQERYFRLWETGPPLAWSVGNSCGCAQSAVSLICGAHQEVKSSERWRCQVKPCGGLASLPYARFYCCQGPQPPLAAAEVQLAVLPFASANLQTLALNCPHASSPATPFMSCMAWCHSSSS